MALHQTLRLSIISAYHTIPLTVSSDPGPRKVRAQKACEDGSSAQRELLNTRLASDVVLGLLATWFLF